MNKIKLTLIRKVFAEEYTEGELYVNDTYFCDTIEDKVRVLKTEKDKVPGKTAILAGIYKVILDFSNTFKKLLPHLLNVRFFSGIRIHSGNSAADSRGCIIVGKKQADGYVSNSRKTMYALMEILEGANEIEIEIVNERQ